MDIKVMMLKRLGMSFLLLVIGTYSAEHAIADIGPPLPKPPVPAGPSEGDVRGAKVTRGFGYWRGRRWLTYLRSCPSSQTTCNISAALANGDLCIITGADGRAIEGGDIAALIRAGAAAEGRVLKLEIESCGDLTELNLAP